MQRILFAILACTLFISGCIKDQFELDREKIEAYLLENSIDATYHDEGFYYLITREGNGEDQPIITSTVEVRYKGYFLDGDVFDETPGDDTTTFPLLNVIRGWQYGIPLLKRGGKGTFFVPSFLGYGQFGRGSIPGNSVLIF